MKRFLLIFAVLFLLICASSCGDNTDKSLDKVISKDKIVVGLNYDLYPMVTVDENNKLNGFTVDYVEEIARRLGVSAEFKNIKEDEITSALSEQKIDCFINFTESISKKNADFYTVETMVYHKQSVVVNNTSNINSPADLKDKNIGTVKNSYASKALKSATVLSSSLKSISNYTDTDSLVNGLANGVIDAAVVDNLELAYAIKKNKNGAKFKTLDDAIATDCYYMCFERIDEALKNKVNSTIESMYSDGTMQTLAVKWFGVADIINDKSY